MQDPVQDILADWRLPVWFTALLLVTAAIYLRGWIVIRRSRKSQFTDIRLFSFLSGLLVLWLSVGSPMDGFADALLSAHMIEHLLLMSAVPPLLLYGLPVVPMLRGLPAILRRNIVSPLIRIRSLRRFLHWLVTPLVASLAMNIVFLSWHVPAAYDFALEHEGWHAFEHLCFLWTSILFWWGILLPWPSSRQGQRWSIILFLIAADVVNTMLSAFLAFCNRPVYRFYLENPNPFKVSALEDQVLGAAIMWVFGSLAFLVPAMIITLRLVGGGSGKTSAEV